MSAAYHELREAAEAERVDDVRRILETAPELDLNVYGEEEAEEDSKLLIENSASKGNEEIVRLLLDHGALISAARQPLSYAAMGGSLEVVKLFIDLGASIEEVGAGKRTPIMTAAVCGHGDIVHHLLELGAAVNVIDWYDDSLLSLAAIGGLADVVRLLLDRGFDVNEKSRDGKTVLMKATYDRQSEVVKLLLERGADPHAVTNNGSTLLIQAADGRDVKSMPLFLERGVLVNAADKSGCTALHLAVWSEPCLRFLLENGASVNMVDNDGQNALMIATYLENPEPMLLLLDHGINIDAVDANGHTAIMMAAARGKVDIVRFLADHGASFDVGAQGNRTLLMCAAESGNKDMVSLAIELGSDLNACDSKDNTVLMAAASSGNEELFRFFIEQGATVDVNAKTKDGCTLLMSAATGGDIEIVRYLIERGASLTECDRENQTILMFAVESSNSDLVSFLIDQGADLNAQMMNGQNALMRAMLSAEVKNARLLIERGASVTAVDENNWTALMHAVSCGFIYRQEYAQMLVNAGADVNIKDPNGQTALMLAASENEDAICGILIDHGASIDAINDQGFTALMFAASQGCIDSTRLLLKRGASTAIRNKEGDTAMVLAAEHKHVMRELLLQDSVLVEAMHLIQATTRRQKAEKRAEQAAQAHANLVDATIKDVKDLAQQMNEAAPMCEYLCTRLADIESQLSNSDRDMVNAAKGTYQQILGRTRDFLAKYASKPTVTRLISSRPITRMCQDIHKDIDLLLKRYDLDLNLPAHNWEEQWKEHWDKQHALVLQSLKSKDILMNELREPEAQKEALMLLMFESGKSDSQFTKEELDLVNDIFHYVSSFSRLDIPSVPEWFLPPHEVEFEAHSFAGGSYGSVHHGKWNDTPVVVKLAFIEDDKSRAMFQRETEIWHALHHPHVVELFGACHVGNPFFVCDLAPNGTLSDYLYPIEHQFEKWAKLYEAALGLQYLHTKQKVVHGDLKCNNILIGADGKAKLTDFGLSFVLGKTEEGDYLCGDVGAVRWKAPEIVTGSTRGSFASDVYAFGMCIIEAVTGRMPWGIIPDVAVKRKVVHQKELPKQPASLTDDQWQLITKMCAWDPTQRLDISAVVKNLTSFVDMEQEAKWEYDDENDDEAAPFA